MLKHLRPEYTIYDAMDGAEALQSMSVHPIDLVFTDIQMPIMNGLELMEHLIDRGGSESIIIMSAYSDFEYAQRALQLGASDYLLKPVEEQKIVQLLAKTENKMHALRLASMESSLAELFEGLPDIEDYQRLERTFPAIGHGMVLAAILSSKRETGDRKGMLNELKAMLEAALKEHGFSFAFYMSDKVLHTLIISGENVPIFTPEWRGSLRMIIRHFSAQHGAELTFGLGNAFTKWEHEARESFKQANLALQTRFYKGGGVLLEVDQMNDSNHRALLKLEVRFLTKAVVSGDKLGIRSYLDATINQATASGFPQPEKLVYAIAAAIHHLTSCLMEKGLLSFNSAAFEEALLQCHTVEQLKKAAQAWIFELADCLDNRTSSCRNEAIIDACKAYIENHYDEELSLSTIAAKFHFNASYFCLLFKTHTHTTINQYIMQTRMRAAAGQLLQTSQKVYQIAENVGYKDVKYFIRLFRKEYGSSPEEYRHLSATR
ncbi:Helix-turn-helix domain-containing protein [Paenibacillus algorifonticola]|uniref:Helix-turn-helix domain-containing protein n=2 Tax=Paenibacillus algorifonticola TaxID=684063 RepID=A0A1I2C3X6_9BACL|nr:Helix-turn-helix domain-containing protein [Paenibacillus algorifonticola]